MRVFFVQPAVPAYRTAFFSRVAELAGSQVRVYASASAEFGSGADAGGDVEWRRQLGPYRKIAPGLYWQDGALSIPMARGDVVVVSGAPRCLSNVALLLKARAVGARTVWWGHYWSSTSKRSNAALRFLLMLAADAILFYTDEEAGHYAKHWWRRKRQPVFALNNGVDVRPIAALRAPYDPQARPRDVLFVGRLTRKAEAHLLLEALAHPSCGGVTLDVVGDGEQAQALALRAHALGLADRVAWHGASVDEATVAAAANRCKMFVYPGAVGLSLVHAMAYGLPAIVHDDRWGHMPEIAAHAPGVTGLTFARGDARALAACVRGALEAHDERMAMSAASLALTARTFNTEDMAHRFCAMLGELAAAGDHAAAMGEPT
ncbi:MAG: hypothetical protein JWN93_1003 [Hyphomicrobiales bacterium]|nr:hypothetical protein [Hyphomicrobiales bacterium]